MNVMSKSFLWRHILPAGLALVITAASMAAIGGGVL
jgi:hypothetical protein